MATNPSTLPENLGRITPPDANYPYGSGKDDTTGTAGNGTPFKQALLNDAYGLQQALLRSSSIVPTGTADTAVLSQYLQSIVEIASGRAFTYTDSGAANAYVLALKANQQGPASFFDGLIVSFVPTNNGTGAAATVNVPGLGVKSIKLESGANPAEGDIKTSSRLNLVYDLALDYFVLKVFAALDSPAFVGTPTAPTQAISDNSTRIATTAFIKLQGYLSSVPANTSSNAESGWWRCGDTGIIWQWAKVVVNSSSAVTFNFPIAFPSVAYNVTASWNAAAIAIEGVGPGAVILSRVQYQLDRNSSYPTTAAFVLAVGR